MRSPPSAGMRRPLTEFLNAVLELELEDTEDRTRLEDLFGTHPSMEDRIDRLRPHLVDSDAERD